MLRVRLAPLGLIVQSLGLLDQLVPLAPKAHKVPRVLLAQTRLWLDLQDQLGLQDQRVQLVLIAL